MGGPLSPSGSTLLVHGGGKLNRAVKTTVIKDNHEPIIDRDVFQAAFNYLSQTTVDGEPNADYKERRTTRPKNTGDPRRVGVTRPFCDGLLFSPDTRGDLQNVATKWNGQTGHYEYAGCSWGEAWGEADVRLWIKSADQVDVVVHDMLAHVAAGEKHRDIARALTDRAKHDAPDFEAERKRWQVMIQQAEKELARKKTLWERSGDEPDLVKDAVAGYKKVKGNIATYQAELARIDALEADQNRMAELSAQIFKLTADYRELSLDDQRLVLELCVERVEAYRRGIDLEITVIYRGGATNSRTIGLRGKDAWTAAACETLVKLVEQGAPGLQIAANYPEKSWWAIISKYWHLTGKGLSSKAEGTLSIKSPNGSKTLTTSDSIHKRETFIAFVDRQPPEFAEYWLAAFKTEALDAYLAREEWDFEISGRWSDADQEAAATEAAEREYSKLMSGVLRSSS